jgi:rod shape-determining protein MreC
MNKIYVLIFGLLFLALFQVDFIKSYALGLVLYIKQKSVELIKEFNEIEQKDRVIRHLKIENRKLKDKLENLKLALKECENLKYFSFKTDPLLVFTKVISYADIPHFNRVYIDYSYPFSTPRGLIYNNLAAGIVIKNYGKYSLAILNSNDKELRYTVLIGENHIPGVLEGRIIKYIPKFKKIKIDDIVITSGLDKVFYKGVFVGKIVSITQKKLYQEAKVEFFYNRFDPDYFYVYKGGSNGYVKH